MWLPLAFHIGLNHFQMIIVLKDRDFLFSLEVIGYFNGFSVYLAF